MRYKINHSMMSESDWYDCLDRLYELSTGESFDCKYVLGLKPVCNL